MRRDGDHGLGFRRTKERLIYPALTCSFQKWLHEENTNKRDASVLGGAVY